MSANFVKRYCAIGWDWHFETDGYSSPVSSVVKDYIESIEADNAKLRELVIAQCECVKHDDCNECVHYSEGKCMFPFKSMYRELGVEVDA